MANSVARFLLLACVMSMVVGCKVAVMVVEGGEVQSIGSGTCLEGTICIVEVNGTDFSDSFTAVPKAGWAFVKWNTGEGFLCADSTDPTCVLSTVGLENTWIERIIASDETYYIMPIFRRTISASDTITVNGKEWAQPDLFKVSWHQIKAVCPYGICSGVLNGYDITGWIWASVDEVNALFNHYIGSDALGPGPTPAVPVGNDVCSEFDSDGWRRNDYTAPGYFQYWYMIAWPRDAVWGGYDGPRYDDPSSCYVGWRGWGPLGLPPTPDSAFGGWFWRPL